MRKQRSAGAKILNDLSSFAQASHNFSKAGESGLPNEPQSPYGVPASLGLWNCHAPPKLRNGEAIRYPKNRLPRSANATRMANVASYPSLQPPPSFSNLNAWQKKNTPEFQQRAETSFPHQSRSYWLVAQDIAAQFANNPQSVHIQIQVAQYS